MSESPVGPRETLATEHAGAPRPLARRRYLALFDPGSSSVVPLPETGELVIGRGDEAGLRLKDAKVSRSHVKLALSPERVVLIDLESQNGTFVGGERLVGSRVLVSGDLIGVGNTALVFHSAITPAYEEPSAGFDAFHDELRHEVARAARGARPLCLASLALADAAAGSEQALSLVASELVGLERASRDGNARLYVLLPEAPENDARARATSLLAALGRGQIPARAGIAVYPADGCDADTLLTSARAAVATGSAGEVRSAAHAARTLDFGDASVLVADAAMVELYSLVERLARSDLPVLIHGETGSGKELAARALHHFSRRAAMRWVAVNSAALSESLVESELFGHEKGAFTGATATKPGLLEVASGGSVFLDEIGELPLAIQAKLLRALDTQRIVRVGDVTERQIDVRVIAATNRNLEQEVATGRFRQDLFFRLSGASLFVPPLRDRPRELALLAQRFLDEARARLGTGPMRLSDDALRALAAHPFPGNVRELKNVMEFAAAAYADPVLEGWQVGLRLAPTGAPAPAPAPAATGFRSLEDELKELERRRIREALEASGGNQRRAAQLIGMPLRTFVSKLTQHGLRG